MQEGLLSDNEDDDDSDTDGDLSEMEVDVDDEPEEILLVIYPSLIVHHSRGCDAALQFCR